MAAGQSDYFWTAREIQILFVFLELNIKLPLKQLCPIHVDVKIKKKINKIWKYGCIYIFNVLIQTIIVILFTFKKAVIETGMETLK